MWRGNDTERTSDHKNYIASGEGGCVEERADLEKPRFSESSRGMTGERVEGELGLEEVFAGP